MRVSSFLAGIVVAATEAAGANTPKCDATTFQSLTLSSIEILSLTATAQHNVSTTSGGSPGVAAQNKVSSASTADVAPTVDMCKIAIEYTHPGQNDVVNTWIGLPLSADDWNSRFVIEGGGGWTAGSESNILSPVASGYTSSSTDGGHNATELTADWGLVSPGNINWPALSDFASVALDEAASLGKLATNIYFGTPPKFSYWNGCSTGGRQGHMMAQRYPEQFDGIVGGAPAINWDKFLLQEFWSYFMAQLLDTQPPSCVLDAFTDAAIVACDSLDGIEDGIISYPGLCTFEATSIVGQTVNCSEPVGSIVITDKMAELVAATWQGPTSTDGELVWYGLHQDASLTALLSTTCTTVDNCTATPFGISDDWVKVFLARNASFDTAHLTRDQFDDFRRQSIDEYASIIGTENPDLTKLKKAGTKLIAWHGMQDLLIPTNGTVDYYTRAMDSNANVTDYYRLFLAPGVSHCGGGDGFDPSSTVFDTLRGWVENGTVPDTLTGIGSAVGGASPASTRSVGLCAYPKVLTYIGPDPNESSSFTCV